MTSIRGLGYGSKEIPIVVEVEGTDGSGKTTALEVLYKELTALGLRVLKTREVGNPYDAKASKLREIILDPDMPMDGKAMELVFAAMRIMNLRYYESVADQYDVILNDRGWLSHLSYTDHNVTPEFTDRLYQQFLAGEVHLPDIAVFLKTSPEVAMNRRRSRNAANDVKVDVIEAKGEGYQLQVAGSFVKYLEQYEDLFKQIVVNGDADKEGVASQLKQVASQIQQHWISTAEFLNDA